MLKTLILPLRASSGARARAKVCENMLCMYGKVFVTICKKNHVDISIRAGEAHSLVFVPLTWSAEPPP